jgi:sugar lactone lactonase YvrE
MIVLGPRGTLYYAFSDSLWIRIFDADGEEVGGFAAPRERRRVTREDIDRVVEREQGPDPDESRREVADMIRSTAPETWPAFAWFLVDDRGRVWASPAPGGEPSDPARWDVFQPDGRRVGIASMPVGFFPLAIRAGRVYGVTRDSQDVPTVVALDLVGE